MPVSITATVVSAPLMCGYVAAASSWSTRSALALQANRRRDSSRSKSNVYLRWFTAWLLPVNSAPGKRRNSTGKDKIFLAPLEEQTAASPVSPRPEGGALFLMDEKGRRAQQRV